MIERGDAEHAAEARALKAQIAALQEQRPRVSALRLVREKQQNEWEEFFLETCNEGGAADFYAEVKIGSPHITWPVGQRFALWSNHQDYRRHIPEGGRALIHLATLRFSFDRSEGLWVFLEWSSLPRVERKDLGKGSGVTFPVTYIRGSMEEKRFSLQDNGTHWETNARVVLYAEPAMLGGPLGVDVRFVGPRAEVLSSGVASPPPRDTLGPPRAKSRTRSADP